MINILLFGAGKSTTVLIDYILKYSESEQWKIIVVDANLQLAKSKTAGHPNARAFSFDINNTTERYDIIGKADIVISMLPPALHLLVAKDCITCKKNLLTASYIDPAMLGLKKEIENYNLLFLCEMGLDPGIDHMSAMQIFDKIKSAGGIIKSFKSHCGGLLAPENDDNPWHYKISWNPINIVNAGKLGAVYKEHNETIELDYYEVFEDCRTVHIGATEYAWYPNRNSVAYIPLYGLHNAETVIRTTLRHPDYCTAWHAAVLAGLTDSENETTVRNFRGKSFNYWFVSSLNFYAKAENLEDFLTRYIERDHHKTVTDLFNYLGITSDDKIPDTANTSADILKYLLETKLPLKNTDKDQVLMLHEIEYETAGTIKTLKSTLKVIGDNNVYTAMAKTVGLTLAIAAKHILKGTIAVKGLVVPTVKEIYEPVLAELAINGIVFTEEE